MKVLKELKKNFNAAHMIALNKIPLTKFKSQILLKWYGMDVSKTW